MCPSQVCGPSYTVAERQTHEFWKINRKGGEYVVCAIFMVPRSPQFRICRRTPRRASSRLIQDRNHRKVLFITFCLMYQYQLTDFAYTPKVRSLSEIEFPLASSTGFSLGYCSCIPTRPVQRKRGSQRAKSLHSLASWNRLAPNEHVRAKLLLCPRQCARTFQ